MHASNGNLILRHCVGTTERSTLQQPNPSPKSQNPDETPPIDLPKDFAEPQNAATVLAAQLRLRTTAMWTISVLVVIGALLMILVTPKAGTFYFAGLLVVAGTLRIFLPGTPFGLSARTKLYDSAFCFGVALAITILTNSASALR